MTRADSGQVRLCFTLVAFAMTYNPQIIFRRVGCSCFLMRLSVWIVATIGLVVRHDQSSVEMAAGEECESRLSYLTR